MLYKEFLEITDFEEEYITYDDYDKYIEPIYMDSQLNKKEFCEMFYKGFTEYVSVPVCKYISRLTSEEKELLMNNNKEIIEEIKVLDDVAKYNFMKNMYLYGDELLVEQNDLQVFINKNFEKIPFRKIDLKNYTFINCNFNNCDMESVNLESTMFYCCDLNNANLSKANMESSCFLNSDLNNSNLYKAYLVNALFSNVNMENANVEEVITEAIILNSDFLSYKKDKLHMKNVNYKNTLFESIYDNKESLLEKAFVTSNNKDYER